MTTNGMMSNGRHSLSEFAWKEIKDHVDLYRDSWNDPNMEDQEFQEIKQSCEYILSPYGMWDHELDKLNEVTLHNSYMNLR